MSFKIIGDSCTDPVPGLKDAPEYAMVPLIIRVGNQEYVDNGMLTTEDLIARMADDPEIPVSREEIMATLKAENFIGRCPAQVDEFVTGCIDPVIESAGDVEMEGVKV